MKKQGLATVALVLLIVLVIVGLPLLASCSKPAPTPTATPRPTPTQPGLTPTPVPTATKAQATPAPTATPIPTAAPSPTVPRPKEYKVSLLIGMTGSAGFFGEGIRTAAELAKDEINAAGGINGVPLTILYEDTAWQARPAVDATTKAIEVDKVPVIISGGSAAIPAIRPITESKKVVLLNAFAWLEDTEYQGNQYFFGITATRPQLNQNIIDILNSLGVDKIAIEYANSAQPLAQANFVQKAWTDKGHKVVAMESHEMDQKDFRSMLVKLKTSNPDVLVHIPYAWPEAALFLTQMKQIGWKPPMVSTIAVYSNSLIQQAGDMLEGTIISLSGFDMFDTGNAKLQEFTKKFEAKQGKSLVEYGDQAAKGYDAVYVVAQAIRDGGYTADGIAKAMRQIKDFQGVTCKISIDPATGRPDITVGKAQFTGGKWIPWTSQKPAGK